MPSSLSVVILAAGQGKRMHSALPKVLHPLAGKPIAAHVIDAARSLGPRAICVVYGHGGEQVRDALAAPDLAFVLQDPPRGTGDAVRKALAAIPPDGVTLILLGDVPLVPTAALERLVRAAQDGKLAVLTARVPDPHGLGRVVRDPYGHVRAIVEERDATPDQRRIDEINTGVIAAPTAKLARWVAALRDDNAQKEFYLTDAIGLAVGEGVHVDALLHDDERDVRGINDRLQLAQCERIFQRRHADALLRRGTWIADPDRFDVRGTLACGRDVRIDVGCVFEGHVELGDDVVVGAHCVLANVTIGPGTRIAPFSHLEDATVGAACRIGPYARLRPGAELADEVHIGNFVEVKASRLGHGAKANHLAYLGDADVGANVNYGAGAITANYDGANKHRTVIGDDVHIGSNCVLVAPLTIGAGATVGAGTTLAQDAPPGGLTLARPATVTVPHWRRPVKAKKG
ncbi:MAG TPA: bifunctional UDP-N-acetylglucosamine diphosphorylase/glucosamine-1-phosphate N-acetyltransferase GlmU [Casimicrobiaceae bacterium]|nr:bifunctional UDP-N-acetylglucosamine diphosphorylase/glucosamine-1-phosphate N-acetyltransferase GlmU [Casimicrobiaceae bacterium]